MPPFPKAIVLVLLALGLGGCASRSPRRDPTGEMFPAVKGRSLDGTDRELPAMVLGAPALLLIGFEMDSQFDLDRWILGTRQAGLALRTVEVPTIPGLVPGLFASSIDQGMRRGIPEEDWPSVITLYDDAGTVERFVGSENPLPGRIVLLDPAGKVVFFHDRGFSASALEKLAAVLRGL